MRVVHLWRSPSAQDGGGGGLAMRRLHENLRETGVDSSILCERPDPEDPNMRRIGRWRYVDGALRRLTVNAGLNDIHRLSSFRVRRDPVIQNADIVHIHGTHSGFFNYLALPGLSTSNRVIFTVHDMWPLTGHCATNNDCERWRTGCGRCPYPEAHPSIRRDATRLEWRLKQVVYRRSNLTIVTVSTEYGRRARQGLLGVFPVHTIFNGIDTDLYRPQDRVITRARLGISPDSFVVMAVATDLGLYHKGADLLMAALQELPVSMRARSELLLVGSGGERFIAPTPMRTRHLGFVSSREELADAYATADALVVPSRSESFGAVALESISCGTPVVAFGVGGLPDIVKSGITGHLAKPGDSEDLAAGITHLAEDESGRTEMRFRCREEAVNRFSAATETRRYLDVYESRLRAS